MSSLLGVAADSASRVTFELGRLQSFGQWWQAPLLVLACLAIAVVVVLLYRRDTVELRPGVAGVLVLLRLAAFGGLLLMYLDVQKRAEKKLVTPSRVVMLVDSSLSMSLTDRDAAGGSSSVRRIDSVVEELSQGELLGRLREKNDLVVMRFDRETQRVTTLERFVPASAQQAATATVGAADPTRVALWIAIVAGLAALAIGSLVLSAAPLSGLGSSRWAIIGGISVALVVVGAAFGWTLGPEVYESWTTTVDDTDIAAEAAKPRPSREELLAQQRDFDWAAELQPRGVETRLGQSLRDALLAQRGAPTSAIVVVTDGGQNAGIDIGAAVTAAREAGVPIHAIGVGSDVRPVNLRVIDFAVPVRGYPNDGFVVNGSVQGDGLANRQVTVELRSRVSGKPGENTSEGEVESTREVTLDKEGRASVRFDVAGIAEPGRRTYRFTIKPLGQESDATDNQQEAEIEIVDRKTQVLLFAGGPTREYQFLRNQLRRDKEIVVHVLLQTAAEGISQDAEKILDDFPIAAEELAAYDCIVAFDPDWRELSPAQLDLLQSWVADESGGLIALAGPVNTNDWVRDAAMAKVRNMYPVEFGQRTLSLEEGKFGATSPAPVEFSREGLEAEFLWLADTAAESQQAWATFPGIYGYYRVKGAKPGATVYGHFNDPDAVSVEQTVYMAGHFFGSGRVMYLGSGEFWRLRAVDDAYFDRIYTKLVRYVSQGRLSRGSRLGNLQVERDRYLLGDTVSIRAQLFDLQRKPIDAAAVSLSVVDPEGKITAVPLAVDPARKGNFSGQFAAQKPGSYRLELPTADAAEEPLTRSVQVKVPDLELENPQRRDDVLSDLTKRTGGQYYVGLPAALGAVASVDATTSAAPALPTLIEDRTTTTYQPLAQDRRWEQNWLTTLLVFICGALSLEWLLRRLSRLA